MIRAMISLLTLVFLCASTANAALTAEKLKSLEAGTVKVNALDCKDQKARTGKKGSGFAINTNDGVAIVTSLHVISGCKRHMVTNHKADTATLTVSRILPSADLAMLKVVTGLDVKPLTLATTSPTGGTPVTVLGFGQTRGIQSKDIKVRTFGPSTLDGVIDVVSTKSDLQNLGIDVTATIINLEGVILQGDSGAPVFNDGGEVVGIAAGGLMAGTLPVSWAIPATRLSALTSSTAVFDPDSGMAIPNVLSVEVERVAGTSEQPVFELLSRPSIKCGVRTFSKFESRSFSQIRDSADSLSQQQISFILQFAATLGVGLTGSEKFNIFADSVSGATFVVPASLDVKRDPGSGDCLAVDAQGRFVIRIAGEDTNAISINLQSDAFARRVLLPYEFLAGFNPNFSMFLPATRAHDGMIVKRAAFFINHSVAPYFVPAELAVSHAMRNDTYLGVSLRSYATMAAADPHAWLSALLAIHVSGFAL